MKYAFVSISIIFIWVSIIFIVLNLNYDGVLLPILGLILTLVLFFIGFGVKK